MRLLAVMVVLLGPPPPQEHNPQKRKSIARNFDILKNVFMEVFSSLDLKPTPVVAEDKPIKVLGGYCSNVSVVDHVVGTGAITHTEFGPLQIRRVSATKDGLCDHRQGSKCNSTKRNRERDASANEQANQGTGRKTFLTHLLLLSTFGRSLCYFRCARNPVRVNRLC